MASVTFRLLFSFLMRRMRSRECESLELSSSLLRFTGLIDCNNAVVALAKVVSVTDFEDGAPDDFESMSICSELSSDSSMIGRTSVRVWGNMSTSLRSSTKSARYSRAYCRNTGLFLLLSRSTIFSVCSDSFESVVQ